MRSTILKYSSPIVRQTSCSVYIALYKVCTLHCVSEKRLPFSHDCSFYKCWPIFIIFGTQYNELMCNITIIYLPTSPTYCCYTTLGNIGYSSIGLTGQSHMWMHKNWCPSLSGCTRFIFVNPGPKTDGCYYRDVVLMQQMPPSIRSTAADAYIFQQDSAAAVSYTHLTLPTNREV